MKNSIFTVLAALVLYPAGAQPVTPQDRRRAAELVERMTLDEKIGQLVQQRGGGAVTGPDKTELSVERLVREGRCGSVFNIKSFEETERLQRIAVEESRLGIPLLIGADVIHGFRTIFPINLAVAASWDPAAAESLARVSAREASAMGIHWTFSPMCDVSRDPRWGRVSEGAGEDPYLGARVAEAMVRGYQGDLSDPSSVLACVKHFAAYGAPQAGREYHAVDMSERVFRDSYLPPYRAALDAGAATVMTSFNDLDGGPATANRWLMTTVLREQWGFEGFVVTDYTGIYEMIAHGLGDLKEVSARAVEAGVDMDMVSEGYLGTLQQSLEEGRIPLSDIDRACRLVLEAKFKLGLFDDPYRYCDPQRAATQIYTPAHRAEARRIAGESFVLLKNEGDVLPLRREGTIAVVGPLAASRANMPGTWSVATDLTKPLTLVEGLQQVAGKGVKIVYAKGSNVIRDEEQERYATMFGRDIPRDGRTDKQLLDEALAAAAEADVVVAALGEASEMSGESSSRSQIGIPDVQQELLKALVATGKPVVLVLFTGRPLTLEWEAEHVPAMLNVWFGGTQAAEAIGDVLFGDVNPSGKLPATFPRSVGQIPLFYNHKNTGRPLLGDKFEKFRSNYLDVPNTPLYPFGYGLSYTTFDYGDVRLSASEMTADGSIEATVRLTNSGRRDGVEVVQLYIRDRVGSSTRPVQELKGFQRVALKAGESRDVSFTIDVSLLKYYDFDLRYVAEPGEFDVMIGGASDAVKQASFTLK